MGGGWVVLIVVVGAGEGVVFTVSTGAGWQVVMSTGTSHVPQSVCHLGIGSGLASIPGYISTCLGCGTPVPWGFII